MSASGKLEVRVQPGDVLGVVEEYTPGTGVFTDNDGVLRSSVAGLAVFDLNHKTVHIKPLKDVKLPKAGSSVLGVVTGLRHDSVSVELYGMLSLSPTVSWVGEFYGILSGFIPIGQVSTEFVKDIYEYFRLGDVIVARTLNSSNPYQLSTKQPQYGVVYTLCSHCLKPMEPITQKTLKCPSCGRVETRKISILASSKVLQVSVKRLIAIKRW
ncbi:MAG: exosome complex RNA-binding protein Csl4 [Thermoprotei archaeon]|nr:exosome complex RNA-binding protein Csl4 [Thermoprotei archaeon]